MDHINNANDAWHRALSLAYAKKLAELNNPLDHIQRWTDLLNAMQGEDLMSIINYYEN